MSITYPLTFPTVTGMESIVITPVAAVGVQSSPFTFQQQVQEYQGQAWSAQITLPIMQRAQAEEYITFLLKLNGRAGTFLLGDPLGANPRGVGGGTPLVKGASQTGNTLNIDGCPTSTNGWLKAGDYFSLGSGTSTRLYKVLDDVDTDGSGDATLTIWPKLRTSPADNAPLTITDAKGTFRLTTNVMPFGIAHPDIYDISLEAEEAL